MTSGLVALEVGKIVSRLSSVVAIFTMAVSTESDHQHSVIMMVLVSGLCKCMIMFVMRVFNGRLSIITLVHDSSGTASYHVLCIILMYTSFLQ